MERKGNLKERKEKGKQVKLEGTERERKGKDLHKKGYKSRKIRRTAGMEMETRKAKQEKMMTWKGREKQEEKR